ncbi:MAG: sugar phosphate isomerase/epimerase [Pirellulales bacterium]|nr:sugar phosphate isomerase/epimerase [Pirellulales bacterium]
MFKNLSASALGVTGHQSEIIELALTYGFRGIDVNIQEFTTRVKDHGMPYARRLIDSAKVRVGRFQLPIAWESDDEAFQKELDRLPAIAEAAGEIGCTRTIVTINPASERRPYHENFEFHRRRLAEICKRLEPAGVRLGVGFRAAENLRKGQAFQFIHDLDALSLLVNMVAAGNIGILLDVWDLYVSGGSLDNVRGLPAEQIVAVQLADLPADEPPGSVTEADRLLPGATGRMDIPAVLAVLKEKGYDGPVTVKASRKAFSASRRDEVVKEAGAALDSVLRAAGVAGEGRFSPRTAV